MTTTSSFTLHVEWQRMASEKSKRVVQATYVNDGDSAGAVLRRELGPRDVVVAYVWID